MGSVAVRTGVQGGRVRSLGRCGVITRALSAWTPTQRSRTDCLPASSSRCVGAERTVARSVRWQPAFSVAIVRMDGRGRGCGRVHEQWQSLGCCVTVWRAA